MIINQIIKGAGNAGTVIDSGDIYVAGANKNDGNYVWTTPSSAWALSAITTPAGNRDANLGYWNNRLYVIWPKGRYSSTNAVYRYDFTTETWTTLTGMAFKDKRGQSYQVGSKVYMHIGLEIGMMKTLAYYDCATETFTTIVTESWVSNVYTQAGGDNDTIYLGYNNYLHKYVISTATLHQVSSTALGGTSESSLLYHDGNLYFRYGTIFKRYNISTDTWTTLSTIVSDTTRYDMFVRSNIIYLISAVAATTSYQYDIDTDSMTTWESNNQAKAGYIIAKNVMYEVGGLSDSTVYNTIYTSSLGDYAEVSKYAGITIAQADNLDLTVGEPMPTQLPYPTDTSLPFRLKLQMDATVTDTIN